MTHNDQASGYACYARNAFSVAVPLMLMEQGRQKKGHSFKQIDVLFLQETHGCAENEGDWRREWEGEVALSHNTNFSGGVGFLFSRSFSPVSMEVKHVIMGSFLFIKARFEQFNVFFINIYAPTNGTERKLFLGKITLNNCNSEDYLFLGGDFNLTENALLDRNHAEPHPASQHALRQLVYSHGLVDV